MQVSEWRERSHRRLGQAALHLVLEDAREEKITEVRQIEGLPDPYARPRRPPPLALRRSAEVLPKAGSSSTSMDSAHSGQREPRGRVELVERARVLVAPHGQRRERGRRGVRRRREHARLRRREPAAVEAGRVAEDERARRPRERLHRARRDTAPRAPPPSGSAGRAAASPRRRRTGRRAGCRRRTGTGPSSRRRRRGRGRPSAGACRCSRGASAATRSARPSAGWGTEYQTSTYSSFDHISRYAFARSSRRCEDDDLEPRVGRAELHAVALQPHDELLAGPDADVLAARGEVGLGRGDEPVALLLDLASRPRRRRRGPGRSGRSSPARGRRRGCSAGRRRAGRRLAEVPPARAVREEAVVQLVRRTDALALDRLRDAVGAVREHAIHAG